jgi:hypothetical protein
LPSPQEDRTKFTVKAVSAFIDFALIDCTFRLRARARFRSTQGRARIHTALQGPDVMADPGTADRLRAERPESAAEDFPSVLDGLTPANVRCEPFPHVVIDGALPAAAYRALADSFPSFAQVAWDGPAPSNQRFAMSTFMYEILDSMPEVWRAFGRRHTGRTFLRQVYALFAGHWTPAAEAAWARLETARLGLFLRDHDADIQCDARAELNTPVTDAPSSVRGGHLDTANRLFSGLLYMRPDGDDTPGGDLCLYRPAPGIDTIARKNAFAFDDQELVEAARVPYAANRLVMFPNGPAAIHGVTPRPITPWQRNYVFITAEVGTDLF